jgi:hypothetical protein
MKRIRGLLLVFLAGLIVSGATAIPLQSELKFLAQISGDGTGHAQSAFGHWVAKVRDGLVETNVKFPFMAYGTDWLAYAHIVIAVAFIGPCGTRCGIFGSSSSGSLHDVRSPD